MDEERINIARKFSLDSATLLEWLTEVYDAKGNTLCECLKSIDTYDAVTCAANLNHRYIHEDIPTGLVPISDIGRLVGVKTPAIDSIISMADQICNQDFRSIGRSVESLGLSGMKIYEVREYVDVGIKQPEYLPIAKSRDLSIEEL
jgi:opine dehydrogenase